MKVLVCYAISAKKVVGSFDLTNPMNTGASFENLNTKLFHRIVLKVPLNTSLKTDRPRLRYELKLRLVLKEKQSYLYNGRGVHNH